MAANPCVEYAPDGDTLVLIGFNTTRTGNARWSTSGWILWWLTDRFPWIPWSHTCLRNFDMTWAAGSSSARWYSRVSATGGYATASNYKMRFFYAQSNCRIFLSLPIGSRCWLRCRWHTWCSVPENTGFYSVHLLRNWIPARSALLSASFCSWTYCINYRLAVSASPVSSGICWTFLDSWFEVSNSLYSTFLFSFDSPLEWFEVAIASQSFYYINMKIHFLRLLYFLNLY